MSEAAVSDASEMARVQAEIVRLFCRLEEPALPVCSAEACLTLLSRNYKVIRVDDKLEQDTNLSFISSRFLEVARGGDKAVGRATLEDVLQEPDGVAVRSKAIATAVNDGHGKILSPFSGKIHPVYSSLAREWYYHALDGKVCLASQMGATMGAVNLETVWVFPDLQIILWVGNGLSEATIVQTLGKLYKLCLDNAAKLLVYLSSDRKDATRPIAITDFWCPHMSHNLWNIQTGWANVFKRCDPKQVKSFLLYSNQNFFGDIAELFPESVPDPSKLEVVNNDDEIFQKMLSENLLLFTVKDEFFTADFARRILARARRHCSQEFLNEVRNIRSLSNPLILTTIRLDNRAWIEQRDGLAALFTKLYAEFPKLGIIIDGLSSDTSKGWTTGWMSMEEELEIANAVRDSLPPDMPVILSVGRTFAESVTLIDSADLFIAPSGSGMALYKWISNMPGLAFSNRAVLDENSPHRWPLRVWHDRTFRHDLIPTVHLSADLVTDGEVARGHISRANFHLNWHDLYEASLTFLTNTTRDERRRPDDDTRQ